MDEPGFQTSQVLFCLEQIRETSVLIKTHNNAEIKIGGSVQLICLFSLNTALLIAALTSSHPELVEGTLSVITFCHEPVSVG